MAAKQFFSGVATFCASQISSGAASITGQSTATWSSAGDYIVRIDGFAPGTSTAIFEDVLVTANNQGTGVLTVTRAQDSTSAQAFAAGATLTPVISASMINGVFVRSDAPNTGSLSITPSATLSIPTTSWGTMPIKIDDILVGTDLRYPAATAQITFLNTSGSGATLLPTGFRHLFFEWYARGDTAATSANILVRLNNDSAANYDYQRISGSAANATAAEALAATSITLGAFPAATATANYFGVGQGKVMHYNGAVGNKLVLGQDAYFTANTTGTGITESYAGKWRTAAAAITRLDLLPSAGNFIAGSLFTLWGLP